MTVKKKSPQVIYPQVIYPQDPPGPTEGSEIEWIGGICRFPSYVTTEGEPYRPDLLLWVGAYGEILGSSMGQPGTMIALASESLRTTMEKPIYGPPHVPTRVRVASTELADAIRAGHPGLEVVCGPTPILGEIMTLMRQHMAANLPAPSYLTWGIKREAMASFFRAAAALFRIQPWQVVPNDTDLFSVTIKQLGIYNHALSVIGQLGMSLGWLLFESQEDFEANLRASEALEQGKQAEGPPLFALNYDPRSEIPASMRREITRHHWEVAAPNAYPWLAAMDPDRVMRAPTAAELIMAEAITLALIPVLTLGDLLRTAWRGGIPVARTVVVDTHAGAMEVSLCAPYMQSNKIVLLDEANDLSETGLGDLAALANQPGEIDPEVRFPLEEALLQRLAASPEAKDLTSLQSCALLMDLAADYCHATIATLTASELRELLVDILPRKVSIDASLARTIIEENRAFYRFLKREFGLPQADACLQVLAGDAATGLEARLSDNRNFDMAKAIIMAGKEAGYDVSTPEGIKTWMQTLQGKPLPPWIKIPSLERLSPTSPTTAKAKKSQRKAARKPRKRKQ